METHERATEKIKPVDEGEPSESEENDVEVDVELGRVRLPTLPGSCWSLTSSDIDSCHQQPHPEVEELRRQDTLRRTATNATTKTAKSQNAISRAISRVITGAKDPGATVIRQAPLPTTDLDAGIVGWEGQNDPEMPLNFPDKKKNTLVGLLASITLLSPFASSISSPGIALMMTEFGVTNSVVGSMAVSVFVLGYVVGPLFLAPLCEMYGRAPILRYCNIVFSAFQIGCALAPNIATLIVFRFLTGLGGAGCLVRTDLGTPCG